MYCVAVDLNHHYYAIFYNNKVWLDTTIRDAYFYKNW